MEDLQDPNDKGGMSPQETSKQSKSSTAQKKAESGTIDGGGTVSTKHASAKGGVGRNVNSNTSVTNCMEVEGCQGSICGTNFMGADMGSGTEVPCTDSGTSSTPATGRGSMAHFIGGDMEKSWTNGEVETERQKRSTAA